MFEFMTTDMRKPLPQTIEDLIKWNYTILLINKSHYKSYNDEIINGRER
jgi:hypothetical protein